MNRRTLLGSLALGVVGAATSSSSGEVASASAPGKSKRSVRQWEEVFDLGGGRSVPLRRLHIEGVDPTTIYKVNTWGAAEPFRWQSTRPRRAAQRHHYLSSERHWRVVVSEDGTAVGAKLNAWWVSSMWGGVESHDAGVSWRGEVSEEGLRFLVGIGDLP